MERRLNKKINDYVHEFKTKLAEKIQSISATANQSESATANQSESDTANQSEFDTATQSEIMGYILNYIYQYDNFELNKEDLMKRKRVKSTVPVYERCCAKRASGEQCTRRKKENCQYCGTHSKGTPHGMINDQEPVSTTTKIEVNAIDIKGIVYYLDDNGNVYDTEDVISNVKNPRIIAKYEKNGDKYSIPDLFGK